MIHRICPICGGKLSEILPNKEDKNVEHKIYVCDDEIDHKFWVSEYESDTLRWNPAVNFEDAIYFRKFKKVDANNAKLEKHLKLAQLFERVNSKEHLDAVRGCDDDTEHHERARIEREYEELTKTFYTEIHDAKVHENLLSIIQSLNQTIKALIEEYHKLETYTDELQEKHDKLIKNSNVTPSGIILKL